MLIDRIASVAAGILLLVSVAAEPAQAQEDAVELDFRGGVTVPSGDMSDLFDTSVNFGMGVNIPVFHRTDLRVRGGADVLQGAAIESGIGSGRTVASLTLTNFQAGPSFDLVTADEGAFTVDVFALGGVTVASSEDEQYSGPDGGALLVDLSTVWPSATGGVQLGYQATERVNFFVQGNADVVFADEDETRSYTRLGSIGTTEGLGTELTFPLTAGVKVNFPN